MMPDSVTPYNQFLPYSLLTKSGKLATEEKIKV